MPISYCFRDIWGNFGKKDRKVLLPAMSNTLLLEFCTIVCTQKAIMLALLDAEKVCQYMRSFRHNTTM